MGENLRLLNKFSLQTRSLHELAKACWGDFAVSPASVYSEDEFVTGQTAKLIAHRKSVVNTISERFRYSLPKILRDELVNAVLLVQRGYSEALVCTDMCRSEIKLLMTFPLSRGAYAAKNFIDPAGRFDELNWARQFVSDENRSAYRRFELACLYCFEDAIRDLWISQKHVFRRVYEGSFEYVDNRYGCMVWLWCQHLDDNYDDLTEFYSNGFIEANDRGFEHAARFFWDACPDSEKRQLMSEMEEFDMENNHLFSDPSHFKREGYVHFFYSLLSFEQKRNLISLTAPIGAHFMWSRLLLSRFYECVLGDVLAFPYSSMTYACLLGVLTVKMVELPIPDYEMIFEALWRPLSDERHLRILGMNLGIMRNLTKIKSMDLLELVIQPLPDAEKEWMLIYDWQFAGVTALCEFLSLGDYDCLRRYLLLFLVDRGRISRDLTVRIDALHILDRFIGVYNYFLHWNVRRMPGHVRNEANKVMESIRGSLISLHYLLGEVVIKVDGFDDLCVDMKRKLQFF